MRTPQAEMRPVGWCHFGVFWVKTGITGTKTVSKPVGDRGEFFAFPLAPYLAISLAT